MAHVTLPDGREFDVADSDVTLLEYYRGVGGDIEQPDAEQPDQANAPAPAVQSVQPELQPTPVTVDPGRPQPGLGDSAASTLDA